MPLGRAGGGASPADAEEASLQLSNIPDRGRGPSCPFPSALAVWEVAAPTFSSSSELPRASITSSSPGEPGDWDAGDVSGSGCFGESESLETSSGPSSIVTGSLFLLECRALGVFTIRSLAPSDQACRISSRGAAPSA
jgi:hypothetical protein